MRYILGVVALLEACDVTTMVAILDFTRNYKNVILLCLREKLHIESILNDFSHNIYFYCWKKLKKHASNQISFLVISMLIGGKKDTNKQG